MKRIMGTQRMRLAAKITAFDGKTGRDAVIGGKNK